MDFCHKTKFVSFLGALKSGVFSCLFDLYPVEQPTTKHVDTMTPFKNKPDAINNKGKKPDSTVDNLSDQAAKLADC